MKYFPVILKKNYNVSEPDYKKNLFQAFITISVILIGVFTFSLISLWIFSPLVSPEWEARLGSFLLKNLPEFGNNLKDFPQANRICKKLSENISVPYPIKVFIKDSKEFNALAFPGGIIIIYQPLLSKLETEQQLAFVMAHEMAHFHNRDHIHSSGRALIEFLILQFIPLPENFTLNALKQRISSLTFSSFSRVLETQADTLAANTINKIYGNTDAGLQVMQIIKENQLKDSIFMGKYFSTHPPVEERIHLIQKLQNNHSGS